MDYLVHFGRMGYIDTCEIFHMLRTATKLMTVVSYELRDLRPDAKFNTDYHKQWFQQVYPLIHNAYARLDIYMGKNFKNVDDYKTYTVRNRDYRVAIDCICSELYKLRVYHSARQFYLALLRMEDMLSIIHERLEDDVY